MVEDTAAYKICSQYLLRTHKGFAGLCFPLFFFNVNCSVYRNTPVIHTVSYIQTYIHIKHSTTKRTHTHTHARMKRTYIVIYIPTLWSLQHYNISLTCLMYSNQAMCMHLWLCHLFCVHVYTGVDYDETFTTYIHRHGIQFQQYCITRDLIGENYSQSSTKEFDYWWW